MSDEKPTKVIFKKQAKAVFKNHEFYSMTLAIKEKIPGILLIFQGLFHESSNATGPKGYF